MKPSQSILKVMIKLLILLILFVCMFIISAFLYSTRYWPDVYNYINANITIKRIPTISELDIQIVDVGYDYTTEVYSTIDADYFELSTTDNFDIDEFMTAKFDAKTKVKRNVILEEIQDYRELPNRPIFVDYIFLEEPFEIGDKKNTTDDKDILGATISKEFTDNQTKTVLKDDIEENIITTDKYHIKNSINNTSKIIIELKHDVNREYSEKSSRDLLTHTTTKEGYLVGDEFDNEVKNQHTIDPLDITTDKNENNYDEEHGLNLLTDMVDVRKLSTRSPEDVEMFTGMLQNGHQVMTFKNTVFPWVATIFIKNSTENSQFHYFCDGALLSEKVILTGGRCVYHSSSAVAPENILVFLGKRNLQEMGGSEKLYKIKNVILHNNFTVDVLGNAQNDLALLILDVAAELDNGVQSSCIHLDDSTEVQETATTAWGPIGQLLPIFFEKEKSDICLDKSQDVFCTTYGPNIPLCPSYGGIYATKRMSRWCLQGIHFGDPTSKGLCFNKNVLYTSLRNYFDWIDDYIVINANIL